MNRRDALKAAGLSVSSLVVPVNGKEKAGVENIEEKREQLNSLLKELYDLDGDKTTSKIRLWRLGIYNHQYPIQSLLPTRKDIDEVRNILRQNLPDDGYINLVWGPELDCKVI